MRWLFHNKSVCGGKDSHQKGFTLIELMIVILILAILVGIVVGVMLVAKNKAYDTVAKANYRIGEEANSRLFLTLGFPTYSGSPYATLWPRYISTIETKITWMRLLAASSGQVLQIRNSYKRGVATAIPAANYYLVSQIQGKICLFQGLLSPTNRWTAYNTGSIPNYRYISVIVFNPANNRAFYTVYDLGTAIKSGTCAWNTTNGRTTDFQPL